MLRAKHRFDYIEECCTCFKESDEQKTDLKQKMVLLTECQVSPMIGYQSKSLGLGFMKTTCPPPAPCISFFLFSKGPLALVLKVGSIAVSQHFSTPRAFLDGKCQGVIDCLAKCRRCAEALFHKPCQEKSSSSLPDRSSPAFRDPKGLPGWQVISVV